MFEKDYTIYGKHATYLKFLAKKNSQDDQSSDNSSAANLFERYIDVYMNAAVFGLLYNRTAKRDSASNDRARIYADAFIKEREDCIFLYRMVMLLDKSSDLTPEERVDRAFRYDTQPEKEKEFHQNMDIFHDYVRGGIEEMYEQFTDGCHTPEDYLDKTYDVMKTFKKELEGISYADELAKLIKKPI